MNFKILNSGRLCLVMLLLKRRYDSLLNWGRESSGSISLCLWRPLTNYIRDSISSRVLPTVSDLLLVTLRAISSLFFLFNKSGYEYFLRNGSEYVKDSRNCACSRIFAACDASSRRKWLFIHASDYLIRDLNPKI